MPQPEAEAALHRAAREAEALRDRAVREPLEVRELDDRALLLGESRESRREARLRGVVIEDARERLLRLLVRDALGWIVSRAAPGAVRLGPHHLHVASARPAPGQVDGATVDDGHDERIQPAMLADAVGPLPECEEGGMDGILGGRAVTKDAVGEAERAAPMGAVQLRERRSVAGLEPTGEFRIIDDWRDVAAPLDGYSPGRAPRITTSRIGGVERSSLEVVGVFGVFRVIQ